MLLWHTLSQPRSNLPLNLYHPGPSPHLPSSLTEASVNRCGLFPITVADMPTRFLKPLFCLLPCNLSMTLDASTVLGNHMFSSQFPSLPSLHGCFILSPLMKSTQRSSTNSEGQSPDENEPHFTYYRNLCPLL